MTCPVIQQDQAEVLVILVHVGRDKGHVLLAVMFQGAQMLQFKFIALEHNGQEYMLADIDDEQELDAVYQHFMEELFEEEEDG